jgi:hypothetical protein
VWERRVHLPERDVRLSEREEGLQRHLSAVLRAARLFDRHLQHPNVHQWQLRLESDC